MRIVSTRKIACFIIMLAMHGALVSCAATMSGGLERRTHVSSQAIQQAKTYVQRAHPNKVMSNLISRRMNQTVRTYDKGHGVQIEYTSADGYAFLWYPGNKRIVTGRWRAAQKANGVFLCFTYGVASYNPVTGQRGGESCTPAYHILADIGVIDQYPGDIYGLSSGSIPYVLQKNHLPRPP